MPASAFALVSVPASILTVRILLAHGPSAVLTLVAGIVAVLAPGERGRRAFAVLRLLRAAPKVSRERRGPTYPDGRA